jgi:hypothetical protein
MKPIFKSKTFWLAIIQAIGGVVVVFETQYPAIGALIVIKSIIDISLRLITDLPIGSE